MNREIKFRVWDIYNRRFLKTCTAGLNFLYKSDWLPISKFIGSEGYIVQQFTGRKDKNGKEIYEGDILDGESSYQLHVYEKDDIYQKNPQKGEIKNEKYIGQVIFGEINDEDDFYCGAVLGWCLKSQIDKHTSLLKMLNEWNSENLNMGRYTILNKKISVVGNIFENTELLGYKK